MPFSNPLIEICESDLQITFHDFVAGFLPNNESNAYHGFMTPEYCLEFTGSPEESVCSMENRVTIGGRQILAVFYDNQFNPARLIVVVAGVQLDENFTPIRWFDEIELQDEGGYEILEFDQAIITDVDGNTIYVWDYQDLFARDVAFNSGTEYYMAFIKHPAGYPLVISGGSHENEIELEVTSPIYIRINTDEVESFRVAAVEEVYDT